MKEVTRYFVVFVNFVFGLVSTLLGLRLFLRLFSANSSNDLVAWIYDTSSPLISPFENIFPTVRLEDGFVLEVSTLFALIVYGIIAALIMSLFEGLARKHK